MAPPRTARAIRRLSRARQDLALCLARKYQVNGSVNSLQGISLKPFLL